MQGKISVVSHSCYGFNAYFLNHILVDLRVKSIIASFVHNGATTVCMALRDRMIELIPFGIANIRMRANEDDDEFDITLNWAFLRMIGTYQLFHFLDFKCALNLNSLVDFRRYATAASDESQQNMMWIRLLG